MNRQTLPLASITAASSLAILCLMTLVTGVSQQWFEYVHAPDD